MPHSVTQDDTGLIRITLSGVVGREDFEALFAELLAIEEKSIRIPDRISDASQMVNVANGYRQLLPAALRRAKEKFPNSFTNIIVAPTPVQYGLARMFQTINSNPQITIAIVRTMDEAESYFAKSRAEAAKVV